MPFDCAEDVLCRCCLRKKTVCDTLFPEPLLGKPLYSGPDFSMFTEGTAPKCGENCPISRQRKNVESCHVSVFFFFSVPTFVGNGPNTFSGSTVSNTELSEFFGVH